MERFFTKKSIALIFATILLFGFFSFTKITYALSGNPSVNAGLNPQKWNGNCDNPGNRNPGNTVQATLDNARISQRALICTSKAAGRTALSSSELNQMNMLDQTINNAQAGVDAQNAKASRNPVMQVVGGAIDIVKEGPMAIAGAIIAGVIELYTIPIASFFMGLAGLILDFSVKFSIYGTGFENMKASINTVWYLLRDTANITFIFILLYSAIQQIITGVTKKDVLVSVILSAVFINFSLFVTKIIVDSSNLVSTAIYRQIERGESSQNAGKVLVEKIMTFSDIGNSGVDLSGRLMDALKLTTIYDLGDNTPATSLAGIPGVLNSLTRLILFLITAWVFIMLSVMLIGRFVMLTILMATSPIGFVGKTVPGLGEASSAWWKSLLDQALLAPMLMFLMLLTIRLAEGIPDFSAGELASYFNYFFVVYCLFKSVSIVKGLSGPMGKFADQVSSAAMGASMAVVTGGTAAIVGAGAGGLRSTLGRGASSLASGDYGAGLEATKAKGGLRGYLADKQLGALKGVAGSSFDVRNTDMAKDAIGKLNKVTGQTIIDAKYAAASGVYGKGKDAKTGYAGMIGTQSAEAEKAAKEFEKSQQDFEKNKLAQLTENMERETDPNKKAQLQAQIVSVKGSEAMGKAIEDRAAAKMKESHPDFGGADAKVAELKKKQEELKKKAADNKSGLLGPDGKPMTDSETQKQMEEIETQISQQEEIIAKAEKDKELINEAAKTEIAAEVEAAKATSEVKLLLERRNMKQNYAASIRKNRGGFGIPSFITSGGRTAQERETMARKAAGANYDAEKAKQEKIEKEFMDKLVEKAGGGGGETKKEEKPESKA